VVALTPRWLVDRLQDVYLRLPSPASSDPRFEPDTPERRLFLRARHYHLFRRTSEAEAAYRELLRRHPESPHADTVLYDLGLLQLTQRRNPAAAIAAFEALLGQYPDSAWRNDSMYLKARAHEESGDCVSAARLYREVSRGHSNGLEDARARLARLGCG
jgi:TolA-binding protein